MTRQSSHTMQPRWANMPGTLHLFQPAGRLHAGAELLVLHLRARPKVLAM